MKRGDLAWVDADKKRAAILIDVTGDWVTVVTGTKTRRDDRPHVCISHNEIAGKILGLSVPTYFYVTNVVVLRPAAVKVRGPCPTRVVLKLDEALAAACDTRK